MRAKTKVKNAEQEGLDGQIRVCDVEKYYGTKNNITKAVNRVSFTVEKGEFVGDHGGFRIRKDHLAKSDVYHRQSQLRPYLLWKYGHYRAE